MGTELTQAAEALALEQHAQAAVATLGSTQALHGRRAQLHEQLIFNAVGFDGHARPSYAGRDQHRAQAVPSVES